MKIIKSIILCLILFGSNFAIAVDSKDHEEAEAGEKNPEDCERMRKNWDVEAKAFCSASGGVDWNHSLKKCVADGESPPFRKVYGKITCNN